MNRLFLRLKWTLLRNGFRRSSTNGWAAFGMIASLLSTAIAAAVAFAVLVALHSGWDPTARVRIVVIASCLMVFGWWFVPLIFGGVDETVDPARLILLPLTRRQLRRGQIVAGLLGPAPLAVLVASLGMFIGMAVSGPSAVVAAIACTELVLLAVIGSRALVTSLAAASRSRRGADAAGMIAAVGGAALFGGSQLLRFVNAEQVEAAIRVLRWTPPGLAADAMLAARDGHLSDAIWRLAAVGAMLAPLAWWWSARLDAMMTEPGSRGTGEIAANTSADPLFVGLRGRLPRTAVGASLAREMVYLRRSPGRRVALAAGTALGLVYMAVFFAQGSFRSPLIVLGSPAAMMFSLQYASNQLGVDPGAFWLEVVSGATPSARWAGRWLLGSISMLIPALVAGIVTAAVTGGWKEFVIMVFVVCCAIPATVACGAVLSPSLVTPIPESGSPFAKRQSASGAGCLLAMIAIGYLLFVAVLMVPAEFGLLWAVENQPLLVVPIVVALVVVNGVVTRIAARMACQRIVETETEVLLRLDPLLNK